MIYNYDEIISLAISLILLSTVVILGIFNYSTRKKYIAEITETEEIFETYKNKQKHVEHKAREQIAKEIFAKNLGTNIEKQVNQILLDLNIHPTQDDKELKVIESLITSYHEQALQQSKIQFWFSVIAATVGFILITYMVITSSTITSLDFLLKNLPGIAVEVVAGLFFSQARETRKRATDLYDRLRTDKQQAKAISITNTIDDTKLKSAVLAQISLHMSGLTKTSVDSTSVISEVLKLDTVHENNTTPNSK